ncbi:PQQ-binding-like beta-propeller repeat protein [Phenylobacterium sp. LjRoot225]|uniref:outer membrane protein assembly factor BamB family protein n=1 Tax=Phenylobacterium sp. LjRoot225 TaxID=3342285 RepID=UPI003ED0941E
MTLLATMWTRSLPKTGYQVTSVLRTPSALYAASNGYVFRLDPMTGAVLASNGLSGDGYHEIRLALSGDGNTLLLGTNGYALGLDPTSLKTNWHKSLPDCGYNVVSVVANAAYAYFGSAGYAYLLDPATGDILHTNSMSGVGQQEVRFALSVDGSLVYVGTNGYALGLSTTDLSTAWKTSLPGCGYAVTSIEAGDTVAYAACAGHVYRLNQANGSLAQSNGLPGRGSNEVRLSLSADGSVLAVGTNGYLIGLDPANVETQWQTSLPSCGYHVVTPLSGDAVIYAGSNGYVYECDDLTGKVNATNTLSGLGYNEVRLAMDDDNELLWAGTDGFALGLSLEDYPAVEGPWMSQLASVIGPKMLRQVAMPGTHDSGTYAITPWSSVGIDMPPWLPWVRTAAEVAGVPVGAVLAMWSIAQGQTFLQQLEGGIRYLDLRLQNVAGQMNFVHGLVSAPLSDLVSQLSQFYADPENGQEVIILDFQHTFGMDDASTQALMAQLQTLGAQLIPRSVGTNVTLDTLWAGAGRIIVLYDDDATVSQYPDLWSRSSITSNWGDVQTPADLEAFLDGELPYTGPDFFVLQGILTPDASVIAEGFIPFSGNPASLLDLALELDPQLNSWIINDWASDNLNIVISDWYDRTDFVSLVVNLNKTGGLSQGQRRMLAACGSGAAQAQQAALDKLGIQPRLEPA